MNERDKRAVMLLVIVLGFFAAFVLLSPLVYNRRPLHAAMKTACLSNLKQVHMAMELYAADSDDHLPFRDVWMDATSHYIKDDPYNFRCPELAEDKDPRVFGYAFNSRLAGISLPDLQKPELAPLAYDSLNLARNASDPLLSLPNPGRHSLGKSPARGNVVVFADGRARVCAADKPPTPR